MGDSILSSLSVPPPSRLAKTTEQPDQSDPLQGLGDETHTISFVDDVTVEIITVTDYAEVELGSSTDIEVVMGEHCCEGTDGSTVAEGSLELLPVATTREDGVGKAGAEVTQEMDESGLTEANKDDAAPSQHKVHVGPHDCPDCDKKFKFASSLIAHKVIHTGERPHRCNNCGRCFSFRQSLDRHKTGRKYDCVICGETFCSLSAHTEHKQTHMQDGFYSCKQCDRKFTLELALAKHLKTQPGDHGANGPTEAQTDEQECVISDENVCEDAVEVVKPDCQLGAEDNVDEDPDAAQVQSETGGQLPGLDNQHMSSTKVRTSGRKHKPTMKIQVINLQKRMATKRKKMRQVDPPALKPLPLSW